MQTKIKIYLCPGFEHKITVQASPKVDKRKTQGSESTTPPASPGVIPRLRAIRCKCKHLKWTQTSLHVWLTWRLSLSDADRRQQDLGSQRRVQEGGPDEQQEERTDLGTQLHPPERKSWWRRKVRAQPTYSCDIEIWPKRKQAAQTARVKLSPSCLPNSE